MITNRYNLPQAIVDLVSDKYTPVAKRFSTTEILKPNLEIILKRRHNEEITQDVSDCVNRLFGSAFHSLIEQHDKTGMAEIKFEENVIDDYILVGKLDLYDKEKEEIIDYKTGTVWKVMFKDFKDWKMQGLIYAWLCMKKGLPVKKIKFYCFLKDWTAREKRLKGNDYPETQIYTYEYDVTIADFNFIENWLIEKFISLENDEKLLDSEISACSNEDCWYSGDKYAVYKNVTDAKAQRVFDTEKEADDFIAFKGGVKVFRQGEYKKCQDYCEVCQFCKYYKERVK